MKSFLSNDEINYLIRKLNICNSPNMQWQRKKAQKKYIDLFGKEINEGEEYFRLRLDANYSSDLKLSIFSIDKFLYAIFAPYPKWEKNDEKDIIDDFEKKRQLINKLRE